VLLQACAVGKRAAATGTVAAIDAATAGNVSSAQNTVPHALDHGLHRDSKNGLLSF
jgi:hypothetical protein